MAVLIIIVILVILAALLLSNHGLGGPGPVPNITVQSQLLESLSSPSNQTTAGVMTIVSQKLESSGQFNVNYSGNANILVKGGQFGNLEFQIPLRLSYENYGGDSRLYLNATGIPFLGSISSYEISLANGTAYSCSTSSSGGQSANATSNATYGYSCSTSQSGGVGQYLLLLKSLQIHPEGSTNVKVLGNGQYEGQGCVLTRMSGKGIEANYTLSYNATACLSDQYYVPLTLTAVASTTGSSSYNVSISLEENTIGLAVTQAEVTALPVR